MQKMKYYNESNIVSKNCHYNMIIGERSNGKTYAILRRGVEDYVNHHTQIAIIRRWEEDFKQKRGQSLFDNLENNGEILKITNGEWTNVSYYSGRWYFMKFDEEGKKIMDNFPFAYAFALSSMEHDKSTSYPRIKTVLFDEFLTRGMYLPNEFMIFMNVLSTIIRLSDDVKIFMCGNTVNKYSPYFSEMGLLNIKKMKPSDIDVYEYGKSGLRVAVEFSDSPNKKGKPSDIYFAFNNPNLSMITGKGAIWEIGIYPHCPTTYNKKEIVFKYFIIFDREILQCDIIVKGENSFTYIHRKTGTIKNKDADIIYTPDYDYRRNWKRKITKPVNKIDKKIVSFYIREKVFYQDNEVGEVVNNYLNWCKSDK